MTQPRLATAVEGRQQQPNAVRTGTVIDVDDLGNIVVDVGGAAPEGMGTLDTAPAMVGDTVAVVYQGSTWLVLGRIAGGVSGLVPGGLVAAGHRTEATYATIAAGVLSDTGLTCSDEAFRSRAGAAYEIIIVTSFSINAADPVNFGSVRFQLYDGPVATGVALVELARVACDLNNRFFRLHARVIATTATARDYALSIAGLATGGAADLHAAGHQAYIEVNYKGPALRYPHAIAI